MPSLDRRRLMLRGAFILLSAFLLGIAVANFYRYASSPTDENLFSNSPSTLHTTRSFPATLLSQIVGYKPNNREVTTDSVLAGDLLLNVAGKTPHNLDDMHGILENIQPDQAVSLQVFRAAHNRFPTYLAKRADIPDSLFRVIGPTANVIDVFKDGASARAGMQIGDLIFRINNQAFKNSGEADFILRSGQTGKTIAYDIFRGSHTLTLHVKLAKFAVPLSQLIFCLSGLVFMGIGSFMAIKQPELNAIRLNGLGIMLIGFYMTTVTTRRIIEPGMFPQARDLTMAVSLLFGIAAWFHGSFYFPKARPEILAKPWLRYAYYAFATVALLIVVFSGAIQNNVFPAAAILVMILSTMIYTITIYFVFRKQRTAEHKKLSRIVKWTSILVGLCVAAMFFLIGNNQDMGFAGILLALIPLSYLYTVGRYRLFDMNLRIRRNIQYTIASVIWITLLVVISARILLFLATLPIDMPNIRFSMTSVEVLDTPPPPEDRVLQERTIMMIFAIGMALIAWRLGQRGQRFIDHQFDRAAYDYRRAASELAEVMATKLSMVDLARGIVEKLTEIMHLKRVGVLFFRDQKESCCQAADGFDGEEWKELCIEIDHRLVVALENFRSDSRLSVDYLPPDLQGSFRKHGFRHVIPIRFKEKLVGTLLIGEKLSEAPFHNEDLSFLAAVAKQSSVAIENAFLYEGLAEQERMKHELAIARRIQMASLPQATPHVDGLDIAGISIPAAEVGGDYFDYLNGLPNEITVIVGDVSGKGTSAALYMSKVQGILRSLHGMGMSPRELFIRVNHLLCNDMEKNSFVTTLGADFDAQAKRVILARAGHLPLFYFNAHKQKVEEIIPKGLGFGLDDEGVFAAELEEKTIIYRAGDIFLFITDGITEAQSRSGGEFGEENVATILQKSAGLNAGQIRDKIINEVKNFGAGTQQHDDQTVVVVKVT